MRPHIILAIFSSLVIFLMSCNSATSLNSELESTLTPIKTTTGNSTIDIAANPTGDDPGSSPILENPSIQASTTATQTPSPTPTPILRQLTSGGCCSGPTWSADGQRILYIDRPSPESRSGLWGINRNGGQPEFITDRLGIYSADMSLRAFPRDGEVIIEHLDSEEQWRIPNGGRLVSFSPDGAWIAWTAGQSGPPFDVAQGEVWVSRSDGSEARRVFASIGGGFTGWFPDGRLLVRGRIKSPGNEQAYWALSLEHSQGEQPGIVELGRGSRLREAKISPNGRWLAYLVTSSEDPNQNGLWLADTYNGEKRRLELFGGYNWRDEDNLLVVPLDLSQPLHRLIQINALTREVLLLTDPAITPFKIANGDWSVSPDGQHITYISAFDQNIWLLTMP
jgi:Tol biopolymer transport system component